MAEARARLRQVKDRWLDPTLVAIERARAAIASGECDVLLLAESSCISWAHVDTDRTLIPELLQRSAGRRVVPIADAGFDARMFDRVLTALSGMPQRPKAVVFSINVRTNTATPVTTHPTYGHPRTLVALDRMGPVRGRVRVFGPGGPTASAAEMRAFRAQEITTRWGGTTSIGTHLDRLKGQGPPPWPPELERERFDYFHGEAVTPSHPALASLAAFSARLREYGVPAVGFWAQPPVVRGEALFPGEFEGHLRANLALVESALDLGGHGFGPLLKPELEESEFQDARNATEHYAFAGREKIAAAIAQSLAAVD